MRARLRALQNEATLRPLVGINGDSFAGLVELTGNIPQIITLPISYSFIKNCFHDYYVNKTLPVNSCLVFFKHEGGEGWLRAQVFTISSNGLFQALWGNQGTKLLGEIWQPVFELKVVVCLVPSPPSKYFRLGPNDIESIKLIGVLCFNLFANPHSTLEVVTEFFLLLVFFLMPPFICNAPKSTSPIFNNILQ